MLDEPLSALDLNTQKTLREELKNIHEKLEVTMIHVTHNQVEAFILANRIAVMRDGTIIQVDSPRKVFNKPKDEFVAKFVGFENLFDGKIINAKDGLAEIDIGGVLIEAVTEKTGGCVVGIRPDNIIVSNSPLQSSMRNSLKGRIVDYLDMGALINLIVNVDGVEFIVQITRISFDRMGIKEGKEVYLSFKASSVHII